MHLSAETGQSKRVRPCGALLLGKTIARLVVGAIEVCADGAVLLTPPCSIGAAFAHSTGYEQPNRLAKESSTKT